jgi:hypothetical protein
LKGKLTLIESALIAEDYLHLSVPSKGFSPLTRYQGVEAKAVGAEVINPLAELLRTLVLQPHAQQQHLRTALHAK